MDQSTIYRLWSSYFLLLLILWTSKGQAMDRINCFCPSSTTASCCTIKKSPKKDCSVAKKCCKTAPLVKCCCTETIEQQAALPLQEQLSLSTALSLYPPVLNSWKIEALSNTFYWELSTSIHFRHYQPPLLYKDVPIFVQAFLL
ncbi:MAG: hypothetical protein ACRBFS_09765 [Aureispira sp.]